MYRAGFLGYRGWASGCHVHWLPALISLYPIPFRRRGQWLLRGEELTPAFGICTLLCPCRDHVYSAIANLLTTVKRLQVYRQVSKCSLHRFQSTLWRQYTSQCRSPLITLSRELFFILSTCTWMLHVIFLLFYIGDVRRVFRFGSNQNSGVRARTVRNLRTGSRSKPSVLHSKLILSQNKLEGSMVLHNCSGYVHSAEIGSVRFR